MTRTFMVTDGSTSFAASADAALLVTAEAAGLTWPSSCRNGTCRSCIRRMITGSVWYRIEWPGLSREEQQDGCMLPCVAYPQSDLVLERRR
jgi:ferredoxin